MLIKNWYAFLLVCIGLIVITDLYGQNKELTIGDRMPDIVLDSLVNFEGEKLPKISDFKGKIVLIDFWSTGCVNCMEAFPEIEALQHQFKEDLQVIAVNPFQSSSRTEAGMNAFKGRFRMPKVMSIVGDNRWSEWFPAPTIPHHIWLDKNGVIIGITHSHNANAYTIKRLIFDENPNMILKPSAPVDLKKVKIKDFLPSGFETQTPSGLISKYYESKNSEARGQMSGKVLDSEKGTIRYSFLNISFERLFAFASSLMIDLESSPFSTIWEVNNPGWYLEPQEKHLLDNYFRNTSFCYEIEVPILRENEIGKLMLEDLNKFIGPILNIQGFTEKRIRKVFELYVVDASKIPFSAQDGIPSSVFPKGNEKLHQYYNTPFDDLFWQVSSSNKRSIANHMGRSPFHNVLPLIDETGIRNKKVNMNLPMIEKNRIYFFKTLQESFEKYGLAFREGYREMNVLVIKDF